MAYPNGIRECPFFFNRLEPQRSPMLIRDEDRELHQRIVAFDGKIKILVERFIDANQGTDAFRRHEQKLTEAINKVHGIDDSFLDYTEIQKTETQRQRQSVKEQGQAMVDRIFPNPFLPKKKRK